MKDFKKLKVWEKGMEIVSLTYELAKRLPGNEKFALISQMTRAAVSIPSNIAEGSSRDSSKDYRHFLRIALGSSFELETQVLIVERLNYVSEAEIEGLKEEIDQEQKMLMAFMNRLYSKLGARGSGHIYIY